MMKSLLTIIAAVGIIAVLILPSDAGNREMVKEAVDELDALNRQVVSQVPDLPEKGIVEIKTDVKYEKGDPVFDIYEKKVKTEKEGKLDFGDNKQ